MKKIIIFLVLIFSTVFLVNAESKCNFGTESSNGVDDFTNLNIADELGECLKDSALIKKDNLKVKAGGGFAKQMQSWTNNIALYLGILAVFSIVFGALMMTLSTGEDEKIKKAKDIVKWGIIGFVGVISVSAIINLVVKIMYSI